MYMNRKEREALLRLSPRPIRLHPEGSKEFTEFLFPAQGKNVFLLAVDT